MCPSRIAVGTELPPVWPYAEGEQRGIGLHALTGELTGYDAIRVNDPYRIVFRFEGQNAFDARCADYH